jgi:hypothetical protein
MSDEGSCVTLIFYRINPKWWKEPALNLASAVCQMSNLTHCELSIGEETSNNGQTMKNVARVFNDSVGVELVERTGRNPQNLFVQLGCSKMAEQKMLHYVRTQCVGKPFSNYAMVRSLVWPRETTNESFFCAELVAAILKVGGLLDGNCNPGAATPEMLHRIYSPRAAVAANPVLLRELNNGGGGGTANGFIGNLTPGERMAEREALLPAYMRQGAVPNATGIPMARHHGAMALPVAPSQPVFQPARRRAGSPPRGHFQAVNRDYAPLGASRSGGGGANACSARCVTTGGIQLTMDSLKMGAGGIGGVGRCKVHPR